MNDDEEILAAALRGLKVTLVMAKTKPNDAMNEALAELLASPAYEDMFFKLRLSQAVNAIVGNSAIVHGLPDADERKRIVELAAEIMKSVDLYVLDAQAKFKRLNEGD